MIFVHIFQLNICCYPSLERSQQNVFFEWRNWQIHSQISPFIFFSGALKLDVHLVMADYWCGKHNES